MERTMMEMLTPMTDACDANVLISYCSGSGCFSPQRLMKRTAEGLLFLPLSPNLFHLPFPFKPRHDDHCPFNSKNMHQLKLQKIVLMMKESVVGKVYIISIVTRLPIQTKVGHTVRVRRYKMRQASKTIIIMVQRKTRNLITKINRLLRN